MQASNLRGSAADTSDIAALRAIAHEFTEGWNSGDVDRIMRFYGERYVDINLRQPIQTQEERRQYYLDVMQRRRIRIDVRPDEILLEGSLAFIRGTIEISSPDNSRTELRYLEIARKTSDDLGSMSGAWMVQYKSTNPCDPGLRSIWGGAMSG